MKIYLISNLDSGSSLKVSKTVAANLKSYKEFIFDVETKSVQ